MNNYYNLSIEEVFKILESNKKGLSNSEANSRLKKHGKNTMPKKRLDNIFKIFFKQLLDPIAILLVISTIFSFIAGEIVDAVAIIFIILIDIIMGTFQEWKAEKTAEGLSNLIKENTKVLRDGKETILASSLLVPGDIIFLESGDKIGADSRIIDCTNLQVDESILTGESINVIKTEEIYPEKAGLSERKNMVYAGTSVAVGRAMCIVTKTGINAEIGKIADKVINSEDTKSPLTIRMEKFSKQISFLVIIVAAIIALIMWQKGATGSEIFLSVIALSVSAMPEGLPLGLTMALTIASNKMSKKKVIVKKLNAVESLGSCTVIASDKTGTLTVNEQTAKKILLPSGASFEITGVGYNDKGEIIPSVKSNIEDVYNICKHGYLNNEASLEIINNEFVSFGDSMDIAFLALGKKAKVNTKDINIIGSIPYESENKYSAIFYEENNKVYCTVKGSLEKVIAFSNKMKLASSKINISKDFLESQNEDLAKDGYRVISIASGEVKAFSKKEEYTKDDIPMLTFEGMIGFIDPIRTEAKNAIKECSNAGIKTVMITGDHPLTAYAISKELELVTDYSEVTTGDEIDKYFKEGTEIFDKFVKLKKVFTRVTPAQKFEIVESYKRQGEFVAVTGDGVNDAPALKNASIGIAMGSGTEVAKETADMIILDDNFNSIITGIKEGRTAYSNIRKVSYMLLSCGVAEVLFFILAMIFNLPMPLVAIQLLWLNLVTDGLQDFALSFEPSEKEIMKEKPRNPKESIFNKVLQKEVLLAGFTIGLVVFGVWLFLNINNIDLLVSRTHVMVLMVFMQNIHVLNCRSEKTSVFTLNIKENPLVIFSILSSIILQVIVMNVPILSKFLNITKIPFINIVILFLLSLIVLLIMEAYKNLKKEYDNLLT